MVSFLRDLSKGFDGKLNKNKRFLHERSHLALEFPQSNDRIIRTFIPMLENAQISERGTANLNSYDLVGRAGQLFSYAGAQSRKINLTFRINLLHVMEIDSTEGLSDKFKRQFRLFFTEREDAKKLFNLRDSLPQGLEEPDNFVSQGEPLSLLPPVGANSVRLSPEQEFLGNTDQQVNGNGRDYAGVHRDYYRKLIGQLTGEQLEAEESESFLTPILSDLDIATASQAFENINDSINLVYCWVNLIRGSVLNNSSNTLYGPPIVRVTHGPMYNNIPCLVENYNIRIIEEGGYEVQTLTPRQIEITLSLVESRTGNFGKYQATALETGDNLTGWESIVSNNDIDPQNGLIGKGTL